MNWPTTPAMARMINDDVPLHKKHAFGAGLHRQKVKFVQPSDAALKTAAQRTTTSQESSTPTQSTADSYLNLVLPQHGGQDPDAGADTECQKCHVCGLLFTDRNGGQARKAHETSIAHQACLKHSHPPSAMDRSRMGLSVLESQGWDPDSRRGLGAEGHGIRDPVTTKAKPKLDKLGLGMKVPKDVLVLAAGAGVRKKTPPLDARGARKKAEEDKRRHDALVRHFYGNPDVEKYLG